MSEKNELDWSPTELMELISQGKIPKDIGEFGMKELQKSMKNIVAFQKLSAKGASQGELSSFFSEKAKSSKDEIEKGLAFYKFILENKEILKKIIGEEKKRPIKFRQSGHLIDQTLKYSDPKKQQLTFFDILHDETRLKIEQSKLEVRAEGIRLTPPEDKMLKAINKLLHEKSENKNEDADEFYGGNLAGSQLIPYGGKGQSAKAAILRIIPAELYKAYLDRDDYSGDDIKFIKKVLQELANKKFLIMYDRKRKENGKTVTDRIEDFQPLIKLVSYIEGLTDSELKKLNSGDSEIREKKGELVMALNPIFIDQINTKYIEYPSDINKRTTIAAGGHFYISESMIVLRDYMLREISAKRFEVEINEDRLPYVLRLDNYIKSHRKKLIAERISSAIDCVKNLGIILEVDKVIGAEGQMKYIFKLNKNFE